jgi:hypothetical protein
MKIVLTARKVVIVKLLEALIWTSAFSSSVLQDDPACLGQSICLAVHLITVTCTSAPDISNSTTELCMDD